MSTKKVILPTESSGNNWPVDEVEAAYLNAAVSSSSVDWATRQAASGFNGRTKDSLMTKGFELREKQRRFLQMPWYTSRPFIKMEIVTAIQYIGKLQRTPQDILSDASLMGGLGKLFTRTNSIIVEFIKANGKAILALHNSNMIGRAEAYAIVTLRQILARDAVNPPVMEPYTTAANTAPPGPDFISPDLVTGPTTSEPEDDVQPGSPEGIIEPLTFNPEEMMSETDDNPELAQETTIGSVKALHAVMLALNPAMLLIHEDVMIKFCAKILTCNTIETVDVAGVNFTNISYK